MPVGEPMEHLLAQIGWSRHGELARPLGAMLGNPPAVEVENLRSRDS